MFTAPLPSVCSLKASSSRRCCLRDSPAHRLSTRREPCPARFGRRPAGTPPPSPASHSAVAPSRSLRMSRAMPRVPYKGPGMDDYVFVDLMQRLNKDRIIFMGEELDEETANQTVSLLLQLKDEDAVSPVTMYCQIPGGTYAGGMALYDCMQSMPYDIVTLNMGMAAGMGAFIVAGGTKGKRYALPNARFLFQQPSLFDEVNGPAEDVRTEVVNVLRQRDRWLRCLAHFCGRPVEAIVDDFRRDRYFTAPEAREYGLIDRVLEPKVKGMDASMRANL